MRTFLVFMLVAALAIPAAGAVGDADYVPITPEAFTQDLVDEGLQNGHMPSIRMIEVAGCLLERDAAYTLSLMMEAAAADGVSLVPHDCYRSFQTQAAAYERRCPVEEEEIVREDPATGAVEVVGVRKTRSCSGPPLAMAGRSNHGWGRAVDFGTGRRVLSCSDATFSWLQENAGRFGWVHPGWAHCGSATREPWHWEWGGVTEALPMELPPLRSFAGSDARIR